MDDLRRLRYFLAAADGASINSTAERINLAQSALSRQIRALESEVGTALFERTTEGSTLTAAGEQFRREAREIVERYESAKLRARRTAQGHVGSLRIALNEVAAHRPAIIRAVTEFRRAYPDLDLHLDHVYSIDQAERIARGELDVGLMCYPPTDGTLATRHLCRERFVLVLPADHPLAAQDVVTLGALRHERFIVFNRSYNRRYLFSAFVAFFAEGEMPNIYQEADSIAQIIQMVSIGLGVAILYGAEDIAPGTGAVVRPVTGVEQNVELAAVWRRDNRTPQLTAFIDTLQQAVG